MPRPLARSATGSSARAARNPATWRISSVRGGLSSTDSPHRMCTVASWNVVHPQRNPTVYGVRATWPAGVVTVRPSTLVTMGGSTTSPASPVNSTFRLS